MSRHAHRKSVGKDVGRENAVRILPALLLRFRTVLFSPASRTFAEAGALSLVPSCRWTHQVKWVTKLRVGFNHSQLLIRTLHPVSPIVVRLHLLSIFGLSLSICLFRPLLSGLWFKCTLIWLKNLIQLVVPVQLNVLLSLDSYPWVHEHTYVEGWFIQFACGPQMLDALHSSISTSMKRR